MCLVLPQDFILSFFSFTAPFVADAFCLNPVWNRAGWCARCVGAATKQAATRALLSKVQSTNRRNIGEKERRKDRLGQGKEGKISPFMYLASLLLARPLLHTLLASHTSIPGLLLEQRQKKVKTLLRHYDTWYRTEEI